MKENPGAVTFQGAPLTLVGELVSTGVQAPAFVVLANDLSEVTLSSTSGAVRVLVTVPSLDTPVCDVEVRRFNQEAVGLGAGVKVLVVSMDLPFAQARWCGAAGVDQVRTLSDHRDANLGQAYGLLIKELRLLARAIVVIDRDDTVRYVQLVKEIAEQPDYDAVLAAIREIV
jgi:thiol peroxidase